jgi:glycosyltransferase involved in cell wall biosynthesis
MESYDVIRMDPNVQCRNIAMKKRKVLFVGSFKDKAKDGAVGGQMYACGSLVQSELSEKIDWVLLDTTGDSVPPPPVYIRMFAAFNRVLKFVVLCIFKRPHSVLIFAGNTPSIYEKGVMALWASLLRIRVIVAPRGGPLDQEIKQSKFLDYFIRFVFKHTDFIVCQGEYWHTFFSSLLPITASNKFVIISNWIDIEKYTAKHLEAKKEEIVIQVLFMGWIHRDKGVYDIFDAIAQMPPLQEKIKFIFLGNGLAMNEIIHISKSWSHLFEFEFPGWVYDHEKINYLYSSDIFLLPSYSEGLPNSLMEAMACGIASIATKVGSIPDLIINYETGLLIEAGDAKGLSKALASMVSDAALRNELARNGQKRIGQNHSIKIAIEKFKKIL